MWLGILFVGLAIVASILQGWLWSFPMVPDPGGPDPNGKSTCPKGWTRVHRLLGLMYVVIYVVLMVEMVPRLWEYQFELPARTVIHACMGIMIGILLVTKITIIRWMQHFGTALPSIGLGLLSCTIILATLSIPFALQAHDFGDALAPANLQRVKRVLSGLEFDQEVSVESLASRESFEKGLAVLTTKCTDCHDVRTILNKPRNGKSWHSVVKRMAEKPTIGDRIFEGEIPVVTAYLIAITPDLQQSYKRKKQDQRDQAASATHVQEATAPDVSGKPVAAAPDKAAGEQLLKDKCTDCHELDEIESHGGDTAEGWAAVVRAMVEDQDAELSEDEARQIVAYLAASRPK